MIVLSKKFWDLWLQKFFALFISVKVLGLAATMSISTWLLIHKYIDGGNWVTINTAIFATIFAVREIFKTEILGDVIENWKKKKNGNGDNGNGGDSNGSSGDQSKQNGIVEQF